MVSEEQAKLLILGGPDSGRTIPLSGRAITLGRRQDNDVIVDDTSVSRRHALIMETKEGFILRDLNSSNGTFVNQEKLGDREYLLAQGDRVRIGGSEVTFIFRHEAPDTVILTPGKLPPELSPAHEQERHIQPEGELPELPLTGKQLELLRLLAARRGMVVSREELSKNVWPELPDGKQAYQEIEKCVAVVRSRIEEDPSNPLHVITVGEFGYMLV